MCEERAQGNGATTVRVMRHRTRARQEGGIPPTKYRAADGGCSAREESRFSPKQETNVCAVCPAPEDALRGHGRGLAERNPFRRGGLHRTRPRSRICIRRADRRTGKAPASKGEHGCPDRDRTLEGKPALHIKTIEPRKHQAIPVDGIGGGCRRSAPRRHACISASCRCQHGREAPGSRGCPRHAEACERQSSA